MNKKTCSLCSAEIGRGIPYHNHMMKHVRAGAAFVMHGARGRPIYGKLTVVKAELPLFEDAVKSS